MQKLTLLFVAVLLASTSFAKIWRVNNNAGVVADFTTFNGAATSASVLAGDTIHIEPSNIAYTTNNFTLSKRLVVIGIGYFLNPADATTGGNGGLQYSAAVSFLFGFGIDAGAAGSKFIGLNFGGGINVYGSAATLNITFEKDIFTNVLYFASNSANNNSDGLIIRKCFFYQTVFSNNGAASTASNLTIENCIFYQSYFDLGKLIGTGNVIRNNSQYNNFNANTIFNAYIANNIFGTNQILTLTNCTIKNNFFQAAQTLPGTATGNQINVNLTNVYLLGTTGGLDSRITLKAGSPAIGAGVTIAAYTPDCGAFGGPDPYKLSGIPPIPSIYSLTVPTSIPTGTATMNVTFSSRNNN